MTQPRFQFKAAGNFINGKFEAPIDPNGKWESRSPANLEDLLGEIQYSYADIDRAIESATQALRSWRKLSLDDRKNYLHKYQDALKKRADEFAELIARESGKPLWEAKTEHKTMVGKISVTETESLKLTRDFEIENVLEGTTGACRYRPLGVLAVLGPFNFPGHLPNGHIVPALLTGNTVIFKPSEKTPMVGQLMAECFAEAGFPPGVFNLLQGEREVGRRLCVHDGIHGVLFTGSYEVGNRIQQETLQQHWKLLALEMGGKNPVIICDDADFSVALRETLIGAYITTGQRCSCTSRVVIHESLIDSFVEKFHARAKAFKIGHPLDNPFMGSLIDKKSVDRYLKFLGIAQREGCEIVMRGKALDTGVEGHYVAPSICRVNDPTPESVEKSVFLQTEIFAPSVAIIPFRELEEAVTYANSTQYGLVASVFTQSKENYQRIWEDLEFGLVNWNRSSVGASGKLPFGGLKKSGNHFPTGLTATHYCTYPVASLETPAPKTGAPSAEAYPGLNWE